MEFMIRVRSRVCGVCDYVVCDAVVGVCLGDW